MHYDLLRAIRSVLTRCSRFYVNLYTKKSQWEKPISPAFPPADNHHDEPPPGYEPASGPVPTDLKKNPYQEDLPASAAIGGSSSVDEDAKLAAKLQAEEDAKARGNPGGPLPPAGYGDANPYQQHQSPSPYSQEQYPQDLPARDRGKAGGFLGKLFGKGKSPMGGSQGGYGGYSSHPQQGQYGYPQQGPPMGGYGGGYGAPGGYGGGYGAPGAYGGGYGAQPGFGQQRPGKKPGMGGMGMGLAGGALGLGAGMVGGALVADAIHDHDRDEYMDGYRKSINYSGLRRGVVLLTRGNRGRPGQ